MKKILRIFLVSLGTLLFLLVAAIIIVPIAFRGQIMAVVKEQINKNVKAQVEFADFRLNLIRSFPNLNLALTELSVSGVGTFEGDTLVGFRSFSATVDILSYFRGEGVVIRSVLLDQPRVKALVLETGEVNWDITLPSEEVVEEADTSAMEMPDIQVKLKRFAIRNASVVYEDRTIPMLAEIAGLDFLLSGDMTRDLTTLDISSTIAALDVVYDGIRYLKQAPVSFHAGIGADLANMKFTFEDNELTLNDLALGFEGTVAMPGDDIDVDINFRTAKTSFKSLLSMIPAIYMQDFPSVRTSGSLDLNGYARGIYSERDSTYPDIGLNLAVENARFQYPDLPRSVENVNVSTSVFVDGKNLDRTTVDVTRFYLELGGNPFEAKLAVRTPISDPDVNGFVKGTIDLASLTDLVPMEEVSLAGVIRSDLSFGGRMSMIERERYEDFRADGLVELRSFAFNSPDLPQPVSIPLAVLEFSPRYVQLSRFDLLMGSSDMHFTGRMENFIPYALSDGTLKGRFSFTSGMLNVTELVPEMEEESDTVEESYELAVVEVPGNIDFELDSRLEKVIYDKLEITSVAGKILVRERKVILDGLSMNALQGTMAMKAEYNTQDMDKPSAGMGISMKNIDIPSAYNAFVTVQKLAPIAGGMNGNVSSTLTYSGLLGRDMMPVIPTINGKGRLESEEVQLVSSETFEKVRTALKLKDDLTNTFRDVDIGFTVKEGRLIIDPFETSMGQVKMVVAGDQGIDQTMNFLVKMAIPRSAFGEGANQLVSNLASQAASKGFNIQPGETVNVDVKITGTFRDPKISLDLRESMKGAVEEVREQVKERVTQEIRQKKEEVIEKIDEETARMKAEADRRAAEIIERAETLRAETLEKAKTERDRAHAEADRIEKDAKGNIAEQLKAKTKAEAIRKAADAAYRKTVDIAENEYQKALDRANQEREKLK